MGLDQVNPLFPFYISSVLQPYQRPYCKWKPLCVRAEESAINVKLAIYAASSGMHYFTSVHQNVPVTRAQAAIARQPLCWNPLAACQHGPYPWNPPKCWAHPMTARLRIKIIPLSTWKKTKEMPDGMTTHPGWWQGKYSDRFLSSLTIAGYCQASRCWKWS